MKVLICLAILLSGCHRNHRIAPEELRKLDGFRKGDKVKLIDLAGREIVFTAGTALLIVVPERKVYARFVEIEVVGNTFRGITDGGAEIWENIYDVTAAAVTILSGGRIFGFTMVAVGGVAIVALVVVAIVAVAGVVYLFVALVAGG